MNSGSLKRRAPTGSRLGDALIEAGLVEGAAITKALAIQASFGGRLGTNLIELGAIGESDLLSVLGRIQSTQTADAETLRNIPPEIIRMVPPKLARRFEVVPFRRNGGSLLVAGLDPGDAVAEDELSTITGALVRTVIGLEIRVCPALERYYRIPQSVRLTALSRRLDAGSRPRSADDEGDALRDVSSLVAPMPAVPAGERAVSRQRPRPQERAEQPREIQLTAEESAQLFGSPGPVEATPEETPSASVLETRAIAIVPPELLALKAEPPGAVSPGAVSPGAVSPGAVSPGAEPPAAMSSGAVSPDAVSPDAVSPEAVSPGATSPEAVPGASPTSTTPDVSANPTERLEIAARALASAEMRDDVADALLAFAAPDFTRRLLLIRRGSQILGWRAEGADLTNKAVRKLEIDGAVPSLFANLSASPHVWNGPLPPFPAHEPMLGLLGGVPARCVAMPLIVREKVIAFLYLDRDREEDGEIPIAELERLAKMAGLAFEVALLRNKIRTL